jgi:hypothetical protein
MVMDRCAVMVDAGYLYAEGGRLCCGTRARAHIELHADVAVEVLTMLARSITDLPALRTYWYDGAKDGIRTHEQTTIAALDDVKVRLGRLNARGQQKGVDALIYRDLIPLAQQHSISDAVLWPRSPCSSRDRGSSARPRPRSRTSGRVGRASRDRSTSS